MSKEQDEVMSIAVNANMSELEAAIYLGMLNNGFAMDQGDAADGARNIASYVLKNLPDDVVDELGLGGGQAQKAPPGPEVMVTSIVQDKMRLVQMFWKTAWYFHECGFSGVSLAQALRETATQLEAAFGTSELKSHDED